MHFLLLAQEASPQLPPPATEGVAWSAVALSLISAAVAIATMWNTRKSNESKQEVEQRDREKKLEYDSTLKELKRDVQECKEDRAETKEKLERATEALGQCDEQHAETAEILLTMLTQDSKELDPNFRKTAIQIIVKRRQEMARRMGGDPAPLPTGVMKVLVPDDGKKS